MRLSRQSFSLDQAEYISHTGSLVQHIRMRPGQHGWAVVGRPTRPTQSRRCTKIFREKISGARADRPELAKLLKVLDAGDVVIVSRLDRLARSTRDLLNVLASIADRKAGFRSLGDAWANTTTPHGRLMLTVLGGLAEFERELIRARTGEGRGRAIARGVKLCIARRLRRKAGPTASGEGAH
jgi:DNA invertase Pin-like site-specific DNA recombinase